ncbi:TIM barrel protein [Wukongibacter sp. M2B1]|uniref:TIM barrel protein n=1 Tax=Wukongibacter sp. M2B1 TaxID=3088895 RepID=UPI003D7B936B
MESMTNLGINVVNLEIEKAVQLGLGRVELCLGKEKLYHDKLKKFYKMVNEAEKFNIPYSVHLPVYIEEWYPYDYFSAFFIDKNREKRELSFKLLELNLEKLKDSNAEYFVLHFPGICKEIYSGNEFEKILSTSLDRLNDIAKNYGVKIYLEYFGSNKNFCDYREWISVIRKYENLGILTDTGHLYFASIICEFDFMEALKVLTENSDAFHIWSTKGDKAYCQCESYKTFHHIAPHIGQNRNDGWAFDTEAVIKVIAKQKKPVIIEPSIVYGGSEYVIEGVQSIVKYF